MDFKSFNNGSNTFSNSIIFPELAFSSATKVTKNVGPFNWTTYIKIRNTVKFKVTYYVLLRITLHKQ